MKADIIPRLCGERDANPQAAGLVTDGAKITRVGLRCGWATGRQIPGKPRRGLRRFVGHATRGALRDPGLCC